MIDPAQTELLPPNPTPPPMEGEQSTAANLETQYAQLGEVFQQCDRLIPQAGLMIWDKGLHGSRIDKTKEFEVNKLARVREVLQTHFPDHLQQVQILEATTAFLNTVIGSVNPDDYDTIPLGQLDRFLAGFPQNMIERLGPNLSAATIAEIFRIGTHAVEHHTEELKQYPPEWPAPFPNSALGAIALLVGEAIPEALTHTGANQQAILANFYHAAASLDHHQLQDNIESYQQFTSRSQTFPSPELIQAGVMGMEAAIADIDPNIAKRQFKQDQVQSLLDTVEAVVRAMPNSDPAEILTTLTNQITEKLRTIYTIDPIAGHLLIGQGIRVITRGVKKAVERGGLTLEQFKEVVELQTETTSEIIRQFNAGRTGENDQETDDWSSIGLALGRDIVQRIIDVSQATQGVVTTDEIIGWIDGARTPMWNEAWRMEGMLVTAEIVAHQSQQQGASTNSAELVAKTIRTLNELPGVIFNRGAISIRESLLGEGLTLSASELSEALLSAHRSYAGLLSNREEIDHQPIRAPESETRAIQLERGFAFAEGVEALRERILRVFLTDAGNASQIVRGCALIEDVYRPNIFDDRPFTQVQEIFSSFPDPENIDTFLNGLAQLMNIYDQQTTMGQRQLIKDALAFVFNTDNPTETLVRLFDEDLHSIKSAAWFGRLAGDKTNLSLLEVKPALAMLTSRSEAPGHFSPQTQTLITHRTTANLIPQIADPAKPLGNALQAYMIAHGGGIEGLQAVREKIGSLELHTAEDALAFLPALTQAMSRYFHVPIDELQAHIVNIQPTAKVIEQVEIENPTAGIILRISSMFGGGEVPDMAYSQRSNTILVNEESPRHYTVDELGEEIAHWIREVARPNGENSDPAVHEFFGFLGRRIVRKALGLPDVTTRPEDLAETILDYQRSILNLERFPSMIDTGHVFRLRSIYSHLIGYVAASNIPLEQITEELVRLGEQDIREKFIKQYGLGDDWFELEEHRIREYFAQESARESLGGPISKSTLDLLLNALNDARFGNIPTQYSSGKDTLDEQEV